MIFFAAHSALEIYRLIDNDILILPIYCQFYMQDTSDLLLRPVLFIVQLFKKQTDCIVTHQENNWN